MRTSNTQINLFTKLSQRIVRWHLWRDDGDVDDDNTELFVDTQRMEIVNILETDLSIMWTRSAYLLDHIENYYYYLFEYIQSNYTKYYIATTSYKISK